MGRVQRRERTAKSNQSKRVIVLTFKQKSRLSKVIDMYDRKDIDREQLEIKIVEIYQNPL